MEIKKEYCCYQGKDYAIVAVTPGEEETDWTLDGLSFPLLFGTIALLNAIGDEKDEPKDPEAEKIDDKIFYYDFESDLYLAEAISEEEFQEFVLRVI
jgi:hypothetical protein